MEKSKLRGLKKMCKIGPVLKYWSNIFNKKSGVSDKFQYIVPDCKYTTFYDF